MSLFTELIPDEEVNKKKKKLSDLAAVRSFDLIYLCCSHSLHFQIRFFSVPKEM